MQRKQQDIFCRLGEPLTNGGEQLTGRATRQRSLMGRRIARHRALVWHGGRVREVPATHTTPTTHGRPL